MDAAHLKVAWNRVMLTLSFKDVNINIVHVTTTVCEKEYVENYKYLVQNVTKFHELRSVRNSESTTCFTHGHRRSNLPAVCSFAHVHMCSFVTLTSERLQQHEQLARRQGHQCLRFFHDLATAMIPNFRSFMTFTSASFLTRSCTFSFTSGCLQQT